MTLKPMKWDRNGLLAAVAQDAATGRVLMLAWMNREALDKTLETGFAHYFSRSRQSLWKKGETSGHLQRVVDVRIDCDRDAVLLRIEQVGGAACHTGRESCFYETPEGEVHDPIVDPEGVLARLWATIEARRGADPGSSWTAKLLSAPIAKVAGKVREEGGELADALEGEGDEAVVHEAADLVYHAMVGLAARGLSWTDVMAELAGRFGVSGIDEKASR